MKVYVLIESEHDGSDSVIVDTFSSYQRAKEEKEKYERITKAFLYRIKEQEVL